MGTKSERVLADHNISWFIAFLRNLWARPRSRFLEVSIAERPPTNELVVTIDNRKVGQDRRRHSMVVNPGINTPESTVSYLLKALAVSESLSSESDFVAAMGWKQVETERKHTRTQVRGPRRGDENMDMDTDMDENEKGRSE